MKYLLSLAFLLWSVIMHGAWYASTTGAGNGTLEAPFSLQAAIASKLIQPGDTLYVISGNYKGTFICSLVGTAEKPIIIKPYNKGRVVIDGSLAGQTYKNKAALTLNGSFYWWFDMEVTNTDPVRTIPQAGSNPVERRGGGIDIFGQGIQVINPIVYDCGQGISWWKTAIDSKIYGAIIFNNGWYAPDREHGHGLYSQNDQGLKVAENCIIFNNFMLGLHIYGSDAAALRNYLLINNVLFGDHHLIGGGQALENIALVGNLVYGDKIELGYGKEANRMLRLTNNYLPDGALIKYWSNVIIEGNTIFNRNRYTCALTILFNGAPNYSTFNFTDNQYYWSNPGPGYPAFLPICWKNDAVQPNQEGIVPLTGGTVTNMPIKNSTEFVLSGKKIFVNKNRYDENISTITIYNWDKSNSIDVPDSLLAINSGDSFLLRNVQDYFRDTIAGIYNGKLTIPMTGRSVAKPLGYGTALGTISEEFGCFILERRPAAPSKPPVDTVVTKPDTAAGTSITADVSGLYDTQTMQTIPGKHQLPVSGRWEGVMYYDTISVVILDSSVMALNYFPLAYAGEDTTFTVGQTGTLRGWGVDTDGTIVGWKWTKVSGPTRGKISYSTRQSTTLTGQVAGKYVYQLTITDNNGGKATDTIEVIYK